MRIYVVNFNGSERLVEANTPSQAIMHVASGAIVARTAKPADVARIMGNGAKVEHIGQQQQDLAIEEPEHA